ncbi:hypothetical protein MNB_SV-8-1168 [hydrothermal vent metagenome]|uniref:Uncharacterized protein n=1 Tax=hydrothermal vent metagenome TaxID=652676 RepID=A0A1W1BRW1_9ZZZZ
MCGCDVDDLGLTLFEGFYVQAIIIDSDGVSVVAVSIKNLMGDVIAWYLLSKVAIAFFNKLG